ncbi:CHAP domain-containing protein [Salinifilum ghardaiensis]
MRKDTDGSNSPENNVSETKTPIRKFADRVPFGLATVGTAGVLAVASVTAAFTSPLGSSGDAEHEQTRTVAEVQQQGQQSGGHSGGAAQQQKAAPKQQKDAAQQGGEQAPKQQQKPDPAKAEQDLRNRIVDNARAEIGTQETGDNVNPYSPQAVSWCALFTSQMWQDAGVDIDSEQYAFTGDLFTAGQEHGTAYGADQLQQAKPGDVLLFGSGPSSPDTSKHIGIVESVDGNTVTTIEGNASDSVKRQQHQLTPDTFYGGVSPW